MEIGFHSVKDRVCLLCLSPYVQHLEQCLAHGRFSIRVLRENEMGPRAVATPGNGSKQKARSSSTNALDNHAGRLEDDETRGRLQSGKLGSGLLQQNVECKMKDEEAQCFESW